MTGTFDRIVITGASGTLGRALATHYAKRGGEVVGVGRTQRSGDGPWRRFVSNPQCTEADAAALLDLEPTLLVLCAGQIETEVGKGGMPLAAAMHAIVTVNQLFPSLVAIEAASRPLTRPLDVVAIGSIADGAPSCFGPVYHASKIGLHHFYAGVAPIAQACNPNLRLRLYRPGAIKGELAWAPVLRLNDRGRKVRARRVSSAPEAARVAEHFARFADSGSAVGTYDEPLAFQALKLAFNLAPNLYSKLQTLGWQRASRYAATGSVRSLLRS